MKKELWIIVLAIIVILLIGSAIYMDNVKVNEYIEVNGNNLSENYNSGDVFQSGDIHSGDAYTLEINNPSGDVYKSEESNSSGEVENNFKEDVAGVKEVVKKENDTKKTKTEEKTQNLKSKSPYYIKINNLQNVVTVYSKDLEGNYTIPFKAMVCSTGEATPVAGKKHKITTYKQRWNALQGNVYGQYATQIIGNILFHSVPYTAKKNSALEYWEYDKLGTKASLGCIRLTVEDAKWVYDNIPAGTIVEFYEDTDPGPLRKAYCTKDF